MTKCGLGCNLSKIDGTEHIFKTNIETPCKFSLRSIMPPITDQQQTSMCVAHTLCSYMDYKKNMKEGDKNGGQFDKYKLYLMRENKSNDGMTIKNGLHILRHIGLNGFKINEYAKVNSDIHLKAALLLNGPGIIALPVRNFNTRFWQGTNTIGYHCLMVVGFDERGFEIRNSWGQSWGDKGYTFISYDDFMENIMEVWTIIN